MSRESMREKPIQYIHLKGVTKINGSDTHQQHVNNSSRAHGRCIIDQWAISCGDKYFKGGWERKKGFSLVNGPSVRHSQQETRFIESPQLCSHFLWMPLCCRDSSPRNDGHDSHGEDQRAKTSTHELTVYCSGLWINSGFSEAKPFELVVLYGRVCLNSHLQDIVLTWKGLFVTLFHSLNMFSIHCRDGTSEARPHRGGNNSKYLLLNVLLNYWNCNVL